MTTADPTTPRPAWPDARDFRGSVRRDFAIYVSAIILMLMVVTGYVVSKQYVATVTDHVVENLQVQARAHSGTAAKLFVSELGPDVLLLTNICNELRQENPSIYWAGFTDNKGKWIAHTDIRLVASGETYTQQLNELLAARAEGESYNLDQDTLVTAIPITERNAALGNLIMASNARVIGQARAQSIRTVSILTAIMIVIGIPLTTVIVRSKLQPIAVITSHMRTVNMDDPSLTVPIDNKNEFGYLAATLGALGTRLSIAQRELIEKERLSRELEIASEIQMSILPREIPQCEQYECHVSYSSAREVGGDYYDFIKLDDHHLGLLVADVSGKSLPGMLVMLLTRDIVRNAARQTLDPAELLVRANDELRPNARKGTFVTMFYGILDSRNGEFHYASAGHNPLVIVRAQGGDPQLIKTKGFPLALMPHAAFRSRLEVANMTFSAGDTMILYTDGINEALNEAREEFGMERLTQLVGLHRSLPPEPLLQRVLATHADFVGAAEQYDDMTLMALRWNAASEHTLTPQNAGIAYDV